MCVFIGSVDGIDPHPETGVPMPIKGAIYTVNWLERLGPNKTLYLGFEEMSPEDCYAAACFRPLISRTQSQDIAEHFGMDQYFREPIAPLDIPMLDEVGQ